MTVFQSLATYVVAAGLLTLTPGLDTALILRTASVDGPKRAALAALGINIGCLIWGAAVALGLGVMVETSALALPFLKWAGGAYLAWLGLNLIFKPRDNFDRGSSAPGGGDDFTWMRRGLLTNLLNPKMGVFYISFLPQFLPQGVAAAPFIFMLAVIHVLIASLWWACLIGATRPVAQVLRNANVVRWLDRITGGLFLGFSVRLALERR